MWLICSGIGLSLTISPGYILEALPVVLILPNLPEKQPIEQSKTVKRTLIFARRDFKMKFEHKITCILFGLWLLLAMGVILTHIVKG